MKQICLILLVFAVLSEARAQEVKRNIPYADPPLERQVLDIYSPREAKNLPVVFWIHGGGWQTGDKAEVQIKPQFFESKGFVFVSTNYRLLPAVDMAVIVRDIAKSIRWVHDHIAEYGGDPNRLIIMGHSAGAQLAALICTDDRYLRTRESLAIIKGCVPVDGGTMMCRPSSRRRKPGDACMVCRRRSLAIARSSATVPRNIAISPLSPTLPGARAFLLSSSCMSQIIQTRPRRRTAWAMS